MTAILSLMYSPANPLLLPGTPKMSATEFVNQVLPETNFSIRDWSDYLWRTPVPSTTDAEEIAASAARARALVAMRTEICERHIPRYPQLGMMPQKLLTDNVPAFARLALIDSAPLPTDPADTIVLSGKEVFRHYTVDEDVQQKIIDDQSLIPGSTPFESTSKKFRYRQLLGAFVASPKHTSTPAGTGGTGDYWVDVRFPSGTALLSLDSGLGEKDKSYVVPGIPVNLYALSVYCDWVRLEMPRYADVLKYYTTGGDATDDWDFLKTQEQKAIFSRMRNGELNSFLHSCLKLYEDLEVLRDHDGMIPQYSRIPVEVVAAGQRSQGW